MTTKRDDEVVAGVLFPVSTGHAFLFESSPDATATLRLRVSRPPSN